MPSCSSAYELSVLRALAVGPVLDDVQWVLDSLYIITRFISSGEQVEDRWATMEQFQATLSRPSNSPLGRLTNLGDVVYALHTRQHRLDSHCAVACAALQSQAILMTVTSWHPPAQKAVHRMLRRMLNCMAALTSSTAMGLTATKWLQHIIFRNWAVGNHVGFLHIWLPDGRDKVLPSHIRLR